MSEDVTIRVGVDALAAHVSIDEVKARSDAAVKEWRLRRVEIIQGVRETITLISTMMSSYRQFITLIGASVDPFYSALIGMTLSTISMILSVAAGLAATGVFAGAAAVLGTVAIGLNVLLLVKLLKDKDNATGIFSSIAGQIAAGVASALSSMSPLSGGGF